MELLEAPRKRKKSSSELALNEIVHVYSYRNAKVGLGISKIECRRQRWDVVSLLYVKLDGRTDGFVSD